MPVAAPVSRMMTAFEVLYEQLRALPPNLRGEIINGKLYIDGQPHGMSRPSLAHGVAQTSALVALQPYADKIPAPDRPGGWLFHLEPELHFPSPFEMDVVIPDIAGWQRERLPKFPRATSLTLAPDWICEVLSPSTARQDRGAKRTIYHRAGVRWLWLVDPARKTLEAQRHSGDLWVAIGKWQGDVRVRVEPFGGIELDLARWWEDVEG